MICLNVWILLWPLTCVCDDIYIYEREREPYCAERYHYAEIYYQNQNVCDLFKYLGDTPVLEHRNHENPSKTGQF